MVFSHISFFSAMEASLLSMNNHLISKRKKLVIPDLNVPLCPPYSLHSDCYYFGVLVGASTLRSSKQDHIL